MKPSENIQDVFLNTLRKAKIPVTIFLSNGVKLQGYVTGYDMFSVLLRRSVQIQLVYKHCIATIVPSAPVIIPGEEQLNEITEKDVVHG